ncbi:MAG: phosphodiester glycosidase family protein [Proteobacteria bacterium]|nr:phosphodiester glycosidase family protein [Pseudomonadota bacterium]
MKPTSILVLSLALLLTGAAQARPRGAPACRAETFEGSGFTVCRYDPASQRLSLVTGGPDSLPVLQVSLGASARRVDFALNAGMYRPDRAPVGLFVANGRTVTPLNPADGQGNFFLKPNGVFWTDAAGAPHVDETEAFAERAPQAAWATQSGPLIVRAGVLHPAIAENGASLTVRDAVGVAGRGAYFVLSDAPVSFGRLARFMRDDLGCRDVLYLDGHVASLWAPALRRQDARAGLGTFVVVLTKGRGR